MWLIAGAAAGAFGAVMLLACLVLWLRRRRDAIVTRVGLVGRHELDLPAPGAYVIDLERPVYRWSRPMAQLPGVIAGGPRVSLLEAASGAEILLLAPFLGAQTKTFTRLRQTIRTFSIQRPGRHVLTGEAGDWPDHELIVARAGGVTSVLLGLGMIAGGLLAAGGLAVAILSFSPDFPDGMLRDWRELQRSRNIPR